MKVRAEVVDFEFDEFEKGRWALRVAGVDQVLYCQNPEPWTDGRPFVGSVVAGRFRLECGDGHVVEDAPPFLNATRSSGLEGDWISARGTFTSMCAEQYMQYHYEISSVIPVLADLDEQKPPPAFDAGQCVEFEGYLLFEMDDGTDLARPHHETGETGR